MILYCIQQPWCGNSTPDEYPDGYKWDSSLAKARSKARQLSSSIEWDDDWTELCSNGEHYRAVIVTRETLPDLPTKALVLWMAANACVPRGPVVFVAPIDEPTADLDEADS